MMMNDVYTYQRLIQMQFFAAAKEREGLRHNYYQTAYILAETYYHKVQAQIDCCKQLVTDMWPYRDREDGAEFIKRENENIAKLGIQLRNAKDKMDKATKLYDEDWGKWNS